MKLLVYNICITQTAQNAKTINENMRDSIQMELRAGIIDQFPEVTVKTRESAGFSTYTAEIIVMDRTEFKSVVEEQARKLIKERLDFL